VLECLVLAIQRAGILAKRTDVGRLDQSRSSTRVGASEDHLGRPKGTQPPVSTLELTAIAISSQLRSFSVVLTGYFVEVLVRVRL
jgi:hypothetical protein